MNTAHPNISNSSPTVGIIGGGQLARMLSLAAAQLGIKVVILEKSDQSPASQVSSRTILGDFTKASSLLELANECDVLTLENEFVRGNVLQAIEDAGHQLFPSAKTMSLVQDKVLQKQGLMAAGIPVPDFKAVESMAEIAELGKEFGWPVVLKKRCDGYDGKGNATIKSVADIESAWETLGSGQHPLYVEKFCPFVAELAMMVVRGRDGSVVTYPLVETVQENHICRMVTVPAEVSTRVAEAAREIAIKAANHFQIVGAMGVEMFLLKDDSICVNELAPRVHNSGHYTIEACECSQFENHLRAVLGLPLGAPTMRAEFACMVNLLGQGSGSAFPTGFAEALKIPQAQVHLYGKDASVKGRKMGHVTVIGNDGAAVQEQASKAASVLRFGQ